MKKIQSVFNALKQGRHQAVKRAPRQRLLKPIQAHDNPMDASLTYLLNTRLLGTSAKVEKGEKYEWSTRVSYQAPHNLSGINNCPNSTPACRRNCLGTTAGNLVFQQQSEILRTWAMHYHGSLFNRILDAEIASHGASAHALDMGAAVRLNGSSDLDWSETVERNRHTGVVFYDYTKDYDRAVKSIGTDYHLTYSVSEDPASLDKAIELVRMGGTAAIVTHRNKTKAAAFGAYMSKVYDIPVNDGDRHDLRFLDKGAMVTLTAKGSLAKTSPFVWTEARLS
jgi:hypothetical protein